MKDDAQSAKLRAEVKFTKTLKKLAIIFGKDRPSQERTGFRAAEMTLAGRNADRA